MIDLTDLFKEAASLSEKWSCDEFIQLSKNLVPSLQDVKVDWRFSDLNSYSEITESFIIDWHFSNLADRTWVCLNLGKKRIAYIRNDMPLCFFLEKYKSNTLTGLTGRTKVVNLFCTSFSEKDYCIDLSMEKEMLPPSNQERRFWNMPKTIVSPEAFSIEELWWATTLQPIEPKLPNDISKQIVMAVSKPNRKNWYASVFKYFQNQSKSFVLKIDMDGSGSKWARLLKDSTLIAFLRLDIPLIIALKCSSELVQNFTKEYIDPDFYIIEVNDYEERKNTVNRKYLEKYIPQWKLNYLPKFFSIMDFVDETEFIDV